MARLLPLYALVSIGLFAAARAIGEGAAIPALQPSAVQVRPYVTLARGTHYRHDLNATHDILLDDSEANVPVTPPEGPIVAQPGVLYAHGVDTVAHPVEDDATRRALRGRQLAIPCASGAAYCMQYQGGPVMTSPRINVVFWGAMDATTLANTNAFYAALAAPNAVYSALNEYVAPGLTIGAASLGYYFVDSGNPAAVTDAYVQSNLANYIFAHGYLPAPTVNDFYAIHFPAGYTLTDAYGYASCSQWCGRHSTFMYNGVEVAYSMIPDFTTGGCQLAEPTGCTVPGYSTFESMTAVASATLFNGITDPALGIATEPYAWVDPTSYYEVADPCTWNVGRKTLGDGKTWTVQSIWSDAAGACSFGGAAAAPSVTPTISVTRTITPTVSAPASASATQSASPTASRTATAPATTSPTVSYSPSKASLTASKSVTAAATPSRTKTPTPSVTRSAASKSATVSVTPAASASKTAAATPTRTRSITPTPSPSSVAGSIGPNQVCSSTTTACLKYYGGPIIQTVRIIPVYYNSATAYQSPMNAFYAAVATNNAYWGMLSQYHTQSPPQTLNFGSAQAGVVLSGTATTLTDASIQSWLSAQFNSGALPLPSANSYYPIHFPASVSSIAASDGSLSCQVWCAYHGSFIYPATGVETYYGVMPDQGGACFGGCGSSTSALSNLQSVSSHELVEAATDPGAALAWYDNAKGEIGDICNAQSASVTLGDGASYFVQSQWSNKVSACVYA